MFHTLNGTLPHTFLNFIFKVDIPIPPSPEINNVFVINDQGNSNKKKITWIFKMVAVHACFLILFTLPHGNDYKCMRKCMVMQVKLSFNNDFNVLNLTLIPMCQNFGGSDLLILMSLRFLATGSSCSLQRTGAERVLKAQDTPGCRVRVQCAEPVLWQAKALDVAPHQKAAFLVHPCWYSSPWLSCYSWSMKSPRVATRCVHALLPSAVLLLPRIPECRLKHFLVAPAASRRLQRCWSFHGVPSWVRTWDSQTPSRSARNPVGKKVATFLGGKLSAVADEHHCGDLSSHCNFFLLRSEYKNQLRWL